MNDQPDELNEPNKPDDANDANRPQDAYGDPAPHQKSPQNTNADPGALRGTYQHKQISARVPEHVSVGVFSTGAILLTTNTEFVIDFLIRMSRPHQVAARVVLPPLVVPQVIAALKQAIERWEGRFGTMPSIQSPPAERSPSLDEVYGELKLPDTQLSGNYANSVMISFSPAEFSFDFITNFFPKSAVSQRVYLSVPQVPRFRDALEQTFADFQQRIKSIQQENRPPQALPEAPPESPPESSPDTTPKNPSDRDLDNDSHNPTDDRPGS